MVLLEDLKKEAARVLKEGTVKYLIGYKRGINGLMAVPAFIDEPSQVDVLTWDGTCVHNLTRYLVAEKRKKEAQRAPDSRPIAIIAKGCDTRALNVLLQEKCIRREEVYIIGVSCEKAGVIDPKKIEKKFRSRKPRHVGFDQDNHFVVETKQGSIKVPVQEVLADRCLDCRATYPVQHDVLLGEKVKTRGSVATGSVDKLEAMEPVRRWDFWKEHMDRCIRCYACRSVCPMCYCDQCVVDSIQHAVTVETTALEKAQKIKWIEKSPKRSENIYFHIIRALHLAGRCIDCGECERVCPVDIPLRTLNKKMEKSAYTHFRYVAGSDPEQPSLVSSFNDSDPQQFIL